MKVLQATITMNSGKVKKLPPGACDLTTEPEDDEGTGDPGEEIAIFCDTADPQWRNYDLNKVKSIHFEVVDEP